MALSFCVCSVVRLMIREGFVDKTAGQAQSSDNLADGAAFGPQAAIWEGSAFARGRPMRSLGFGVLHARSDAFAD